MRDFMVGEFIPKISIIVPVFNVAKYLCRCLDSIHSQTFMDWECILIDDGSSDGSGEICNKYAEQDKRFCVLHQRNAGVSAARNAGLDMVRGKWIGFVDSDDWVEANMFEFLYESANKMKADCVICGFFGQSCRHVKKIYKAENALTLMFSSKGFGGWSFLRLISAEKICNVRFDVNISYMEDVKFFYEAFHNCNRIYWDNTPLYHYEQTVDSVTHKFGLTSSAKTGLEMLDNLRLSEPKKNISKAILLYKLHFCIGLAMMYVKKGKIQDESFVFLQNYLQRYFFIVLFSASTTFFTKCWLILICFPFLSKPLRGRWDE